jgi:hypothetical protein
LNDINLFIRKIIYQYKGSVTLEYIKSLTVPAYIKEISYLAKILEEQNNET